MGTYCLPIQNIPYKEYFFVWGQAALNCRTSWPPWYCPKPPQKCFGRGRRIRRSNCSNYHFIYLFIYWAKFTSSPQKKWRWELLYKRPFFFFGKKWAQFATFMRFFFSEFAIYRQKVPTHCQNKYNRNPRIFFTFLSFLP